MPSDNFFCLTELIASGRLSLHYQPRIRGIDQRLVGAEALLRWSPDGQRWESVQALRHFDAEDFALLWRWKLGQLANGFAFLEENGLLRFADSTYFFISLNLSHKQLTDHRWVRDVLEWLSLTGLPGSCLEIELTKQGGLEDQALTESAFEQLRAEGVVLALDDFPEGSASLLRLAQFCFDKVKIDRAMVPRMTDSVPVWMRKREIIDDLIALATRRGARVVIEGVEREVQYKFLSGLNVSEWQGFLWGRAMPIDRLSGRKVKVVARAPEYCDS